MERRQRNIAFEMRQNLQYLGPLPPELMEYGAVGVGLLTVSKQPEVAKAFIKFMGDPANAALLRKGYMEPPLN